MKILHVNTNDINGGAARAAYRLHNALLEQGVSSQMLVQLKSSSDPTIIGPNSIKDKFLSRIRPVVDSFPLRKYKNIGSSLFSPSWLPFSNIIDRINILNPDVVHLHWVTGGMLRIEDIKKINVPIVWTLHDMWPFTDGYHYDTRFSTEISLSSGENKIPLQKSIFRRKLSTYKSIEHLTIVGVSKWIYDCSKKSALLSDKTHTIIPNPINTKTYSPFDSVYARELFNLPQDKKLILFGAIGATSDPRKGFKELCEALSFISSDYELVIFGVDKPQTVDLFKQKSNYIGYLNDDYSLRALYSACDVMVVPSLLEAFGQTASESLSCGTPVVAFGATGLLDIVEHKKNGYLAESYSTKDLSNGIEWILSNDNYKSISTYARNSVLKKFKSDLVAKKFIDLYHKILE